jgi:glycine cleavage system H lipoate-binding protein
MAALLVICTFAVFILADYLVGLRARARAQAELAPAAVPTGPRPRPRAEGVRVAGYELPEDLHYHRGHTWARVEDDDTVTVGLDDFAHKLVGRVTEADLPPVGSYVRQGTVGARLHSDDRMADVLSPVEGEVVEVNPALAEDPGLSSRDPYADGWLVRIRSANIEAALRNLLSGSLARRWIEDAREHLGRRLMALAGSALQDGGEPAPEFASHLDRDDWNELVAQFLLTRTEDA